MNFNILIWTISGTVSGYIYGVVTLPFLNVKFNKSFSFAKQLSYIVFLFLFGLISGFIRGYTGEDVLTNIIKLIK